MVRNRNDKLARLLRAVGIDQPARDFTQLVMNEIRAQEQEETAADPALQSLLQHAALEKASDRFTAAVMGKVKTMKPPVLYKPIISKKVWYAIAASFVLLASLSGFSQPESGSTQVLVPYLAVIGNTISNFFGSSGKFSSVYPLTFLSIVVLLLADYLIRRRYHSLADQ